MHDSPGFALRSSRVVLHPDHAPVAATIVICDGRIAAIHREVAPPGDVSVHDCGDLVVMPGIVDTHAHVNEPGRTQWEGFETATRAAAAGGITTLVDMPLNSIPPTTSAEALALKMQAAAGHCRVDHAFWGGLVPGNAASQAALIGAGALGSKAFLIESGVEEFRCVGEDDLRKDRAGDESKLPRAGRLVLLDDFRARDVGRHEIGSELDPAETQTERLGERTDEQRFGESGDADKERMPPGENRDQNLLHDVGLTHDDLTQRFRQAVECGMKFRELSCVFGGVGRLRHHDGPIPANGRPRLIVPISTRAAEGRPPVRGSDREGPSSPPPNWPVVLPDGG